MTFFCIYIHCVHESSERCGSGNICVCGVVPHSDEIICCGKDVRSPCPFIVRSLLRLWRSGLQEVWDNKVARQQNVEAESPFGETKRPVKQSLALFETKSGVVAISTVLCRGMGVSVHFQLQINIFTLPHGRFFNSALSWPICWLATIAGCRVSCKISLVWDSLIHCMEGIPRWFPWQELWESAVLYRGGVVTKMYTCYLLKIAFENTSAKVETLGIVSCLSPVF